MLASEPSDTSACSMNGKNTFFRNVEIDWSSISAEKKTAYRHITVLVCVFVLVFSRVIV